jgi:hypothetical protein
MADLLLLLPCCQEQNDAQCCCPGLLRKCLLDVPGAPLLLLADWGWEAAAGVWPLQTILTLGNGGNTYLTGA